MGILTFGSKIAAPRDALSLDHPGEIRERFDSNNLRRVEMRLYNAAATTVLGGWYELAFDGDEETNPKVITIASGAASGAVTGAIQYAVVATEVVATGNWSWFVVQGNYSALVEGTTDVAKDDYLKFATGTSTTAPIKDSSTVRSTTSVAIARAAQTANSAVLTDVYIFGVPIAVAT
jgi:hypothetical protein